MMNLRYIPILLTVLLLPCFANAGVKIGNIQFDERGKIIFANTSSGKIIFPDKTEQWTATAKGDPGPKGDLGDKGDKGDKGDPGQVDKAAICKVYADEGISQPAFCAKKIIFVSSQMFNGNLGGLAGADAKCQGMADAAGLTGVFKAWLSDSKTSARDRLVHHVGSYVRTDGAVVAINWFDLTDGWLKEPIACDEKKSCSTEDSAIWASTQRNGDKTAVYYCLDWETADSQYSAQGGTNLEISPYWTDGHGYPCNWSTLRLYCIEQ